MDILRLAILVNQPLGKAGTVCKTESALLAIGYFRSKDESVLVTDFIRLSGIDDSLFTFTVNGLNALSFS